MNRSNNKKDTMNQSLNSIAMKQQVQQAEQMRKEQQLKQSASKLQFKSGAQTQRVETTDQMHESKLR